MRSVFNSSDEASNYRLSDPKARQHNLRGIHAGACLLGTMPHVPDSLPTIPASMKPYAVASSRSGFVYAMAATSKYSRLALFARRKLRCFSELNQASAVALSSKW